MKKLILLIGLLYTVCFMANPAFGQSRRVFFADKALKRALTARRIENTTCQGPSEIYFDNKTYQWQSASAEQSEKSPCTAKYELLSSSASKYSNDWATRSVFYSQLIANPKEETVLDTVRRILPQFVSEKISEKISSADMIFSYRFLERQPRKDLLHYAILRALRQSDQSIRIYKFELVVQANTRANDGTLYNSSIPQESYNLYNRLIKENRPYWFKSMEELRTKN